MRFLVASYSLRVLVCAGIRYPGMCVPKVLKSAGHCRVTGDRRTGIQVSTPGIFLSSGTLSAIVAMVWLHGSLLGQNGAAINLSDCHRSVFFFFHTRSQGVYKWVNVVHWYMEVFSLHACIDRSTTRRFGNNTPPFLREHFVEVCLSQHTWYNKFLPLY